MGKVTVAGDAHRLDQSNPEFARNNGRRYEAAAGNTDNREKRPRTSEAPGKRAGIAMKLVP